jgi:hypothetical protein
MAAASVPDPRRVDRSRPPGRCGRRSPHASQLCRPGRGRGRGGVLLDGRHKPVSERVAPVRFAFSPVPGLPVALRRRPGFRGKVLPKGGVTGGRAERTTSAIPEEVLPRTGRGTRNRAGRDGGEPGQLVRGGCPMAGAAIRLAARALLRRSAGAPPDRAAHMMPGIPAHGSKAEGRTVSWSGMAGRARPWPPPKGAQRSRLRSAPSPHRKVPVVCRGFTVPIRRSGGEMEGACAFPKRAARPGKSVARPGKSVAHASDTFSRSCGHTGVCRPRPLPALRWAATLSPAFSGAIPRLRRAQQERPIPG